MATPKSAEIVLQRGVHHVLKDIGGDPIKSTGTTPTFTIWNCIDNSIFEISNDASTRKFFGIALPSDAPSPTIISKPRPQDSNICKAGKTYRNCDLAPRHIKSKKDVSDAPPSQDAAVPHRRVSTVSPAALQPEASGVPKPIASWKDDKAVGYLLQTWKDYKNLFDSTTIRNDAVWSIIAEELAVANDKWIYSGSQCENKFKDVRKSYVKVRDHNNQTGAEPRTCKFYTEMENILGDKPCVKPVAIASNLRKRAADVASVDPIDEEGPDNDGLHVGAEKPKSKPKKTRVQKELDHWNEALRADAQKREEAREKRHLEGIATFREVMSKLIDKL